MAWLTWAFHRVGYVVRPYDTLADRRRWFWQPRQRCGWNWQRTPDGWYSGPERHDHDVDRQHVDLCGQGKADPCFEDDFTGACACWCHQSRTTGSQSAPEGGANHA